MDDDIKLLGYVALRLYGHIAITIQLHYVILSLVPNLFVADSIRTFPNSARCASFENIYIF